MMLFKDPTRPRRVLSHPPSPAPACHGAAAHMHGPPRDAPRRASRLRASEARGDACAAASGVVWGVGSGEEKEGGGGLLPHDRGW